MPIFSGVATEMPSGPSSDFDTDIRVAADYRDRCAGHGETVGIGYVAGNYADVLPGRGKARVAEPYKDSSHAFFHKPNVLPDQNVTRSDTCMIRGLRALITRPKRPFT